MKDQPPHRNPAKPEAPDVPVSSPDGENELLRADKLVKSFRRRRVVDQVDIVVNRGEIVGLLGKNGAGKTTTFYMIIGLIRPDEGKVFFRGRDVTGLAIYKRARLGMGYLSQEPSVFQNLTVEENLLAILETMEPNAGERKRKLQHFLEELSISHLAKQKAYTLSGGERRRLEITRALVTSPCFIMLDEPFSGVDPIAVFDVQEIIRDLREKGIGILFTDHSVRETLSVVDRAYIINEGRVECSGTSEFLINHPTARKIYLGEQFTM
ncbi:LPS export ABC transporter ATP-binding protein [bacterium]|nr:LPS export ABC transporter ATP-binding protein [bacterium]